MLSGNSRRPAFPRIELRRVSRIKTENESSVQIPVIMGQVKLPPRARQIIYKAHCACRTSASHVRVRGQTLNSKLDEHKGYLWSEEWLKSGLAVHKENCKDKTLIKKAAPFHWVHDARDHINKSRSCLQARKYRELKVKHIPT